MSRKKEMVREFLKSIESGDSKPLSYVKAYVQHNLGIEDGLEGLGKVLKALPKGSAKVRTVRLLEDGDHVVAHTEYDFFGPKIGFDIFRFDGGEIVEHWDNLAENPLKPNPSGRSPIDGPTEVSDVDKTAANKALVRDFVSTVLVRQQFEKLFQYVEGDHYIQHNTQIGDGLNALRKALEFMTQQGRAIAYKRIHKVLGEGNFVLAVSEGTLGTDSAAYYDLFRVENARVVEHWDVIEIIPPRDKWAHENGKF